MAITKNKVVSLTYELKLDNDKGQVVDQADKDQPLVFLFGVGNLLPKFESNIESLNVNDTFEFTLEADDAYGHANDEALIELPIDIFKVEGKVDENMLQVGNVIPMQDNNGNPLEGLVVEVGAEQVKMDFNHPLAGKTLHFTGAVVDIREASAEEISHGHVHGAHGHQH